jgi:hypothetical protein
VAGTTCEAGGVAEEEDGRRCRAVVADYSRAVALVSYSRRRRAAWKRRRAVAAFSSASLASLTMASRRARRAVASASGLVVIMTSSWQRLGDRWQPRTEARRGGGLG